MNRNAKIILSVLAVFAFCCQTKEAPAEHRIVPLADTEAFAEDNQASVWICKSPSSERYHTNQKCGGLGRCKHEIEKLSVKEAKAIGFSKCRYKKCR